MKRFVCVAAILATFAGRVASAEPTPLAPPDRPKVVAAASDVIEQAHYGTFVTIGDDGQPSARVIDPSPPDQDLAVWVVSTGGSRKTAQLRKDPRATLLYFDREHLAYVTLIGSTTFVSDPAEIARHWQAKWTQFYPEGPNSADVMLIRFTPNTVEILSRAHKLLDNPLGLATLKLK